MHDEQPASVGRLVDKIMMDFDAAEIRPAIIAQSFIVIARDEDDPRALAHFAQEFLYDVIVRLRPGRSAFYAPKIDNVSNKVDRRGVMALQKG